MRRRRRRPGEDLGETESGRRKGKLRGLAMERSTCEGRKGRTLQGLRVRGEESDVCEEDWALFEMQRDHWRVLSRERHDLICIFQNSR